VADIVGFPNSHLNHGTPRSVGIETSHQMMQDQNIQTIPNIQGPPASVEVLLRQTSFQAPKLFTWFPNGNGSSNIGYHQAIRKKSSFQ
jgi:uncharacterized glyoxalase superfamily metalloenzyme YdcJ